MIIRTKCGEGRHRSEQGSATVSALIVGFALLGMSGAILTMTMSTEREWSASADRDEAMACASSGIAHVVDNLYAGALGDVGSAGAPVGFGGGSYWASVVDNGDDTFTVTSTATVRGVSQALEAVVVRTAGGGVFHNALFAGNSSGDPLYALELGGKANQADKVLGDVYSGGDVDVSGDATATGILRAGGTVTGAAGESNVSQPGLDLSVWDFENTADYDVYDLFVNDPSLTYTSNNAGGKAWQVPSTNPAHIFRVNPSDRSTEYTSTAKADFFLEDPYESVHVDSSQNGSDPYRVSLSADGNDKVYFVDGNLWVHNKKSYSFQFKSETGGTRVTFAVKGNIYFSDNLFYDDDVLDGVAFIAMKDANVQDSGNIYFGDGTFGTLMNMDSFMYAENDFYDTNLDASGSTNVTVRGIMSAGNKVEIERDYGSNHTQLVVDYDDRVATGALELPGITLQDQGGEESYDVACWRVVAAP